MGFFSVSLLDLLGFLNGFFLYIKLVMHFNNVGVKFIFLRDELKFFAQGFHDFK
jgi:hypothetical protein